MSDPIKAVRDAFRGNPSPAYIGSYAEPAYIATAKLIVVSIGAKADGDRTQEENRAVHEALGTLQSYMEEQKTLREEVNSKREAEPVMTRQRALELAAQAWGTPKTKHLDVIPALTIAFTDILLKYAVRSEPVEARPLMTKERALELAEGIWSIPAMATFTKIEALTEAVAELLIEQSKGNIPNDLTLVGKKELEKTERQAERYRLIRERVGAGDTGCGRSLGDTGKFNVGITFKQRSTAQELHRLLLGLELDGSVPEEKKPEPEKLPEPNAPRSLTFEEELTSLLNRYSRENNSNTPDFLLASFLLTCLENFDATVNARNRWATSRKL